VCGSEARALRYVGLVDKAFRAAPGEWSMYDCHSCGVAYLDPRPDEASIGRAYSRYYTHGDHSRDQMFEWRRTGLKDRLKAGYLNAKYGYGFPSGLAIGSLVLHAFPKVRDRARFVIRHLPAPASPDERLLDIGCGNGDFLLAAKDLGYSVTGLEPDPAAVAMACERGLDVRCAVLPDPDFSEDGFAHITLNHVLEHLHHPRAALA
jgi:SAM-dependent methyltransferase